MLLYFGLTDVCRLYVLDIFIAVSLRSIQWIDLRLTESRVFAHSQIVCPWHCPYWVDLRLTDLCARSQNVRA
jgi:hypothetical protein